MYISTLFSLFYCLHSSSICIFILLLVEYGNYSIVYCGWQMAPTSNARKTRKTNTQYCRAYHKKCPSISAKRYRKEEVPQGLWKIHHWHRQLWGAQERTSWKETTTKNDVRDWCERTLTFLIQSSFHQSFP